MRWKSWTAGLALLLLALAVRLPALPAGLPYMSYVDEGHVLHHVLHLLVKRTWEPDTYSYGSLPFYLIAGTTLAWSPVYAAIHGHPLANDLSSSPYQYYDIVEPVDVLVIGRLVTLAFSLGVVALAGLLARRLAGAPAGLFAAWLAALVPALVARSSIVNINPMVAFFALAALFFAEGARDGSRPRRDAALAGAMTGLAAATKYPALLVCLPVALAILLAQAAWTEKLRRLLLAGGAAAAALLLAMPALVLRPANVMAATHEMSQIYGTQEIGNYWDQAVRRAEWDLPLEHPEVGIVFLVLVAAGIAVALRDRRWSRSAWGWLLFAAATGLLVAPYKFRAFRNLLTLVPLGCVLAALLYAEARRRLSRPFRPVLLDLAAALLPVVLFASAIYQYSASQFRLEDSRTAALHWLARHARPDQRILFSEELAFLPGRVESLPSETAVRPWEKAWNRIWNRRFNYLVIGEVVTTEGHPLMLPTMREWIQQNYRLEATFGSEAGLPGPFLLKGNRQVIYILRRKPPPS
ncbi:MAG TPA: glycosyltransferase family 39 protein [Thermoanaerobaculia bacterium]|nr:glycosyltransferase family 39 protein [Thermoanaerobaculia bacterium]